MLSHAGKSCVGIDVVPSGRVEVDEEEDLSLPEYTEDELAGLDKTQLNAEIAALEGPGLFRNHPCLS
jgi:hypothetical protein